MIDVILIVITSFITATLKVLFPILIITLIIIVLKICLRYKRFGKSEFRAFKKTENIKFTDMIKCMIKEIGIYTIIIDNKEMFADLIVLSETSIYLLKIEKYIGNIKGNKNDLTLKCRINENKEIDIKNPFYYLELDKKKLLLLDSNLVIKPVLVTNSGINVLINDIDKNQIYNIANFYYMMEFDLKKTKIYDKRYLVKLAKLIKER